MYASGQFAFEKSERQKRASFFWYRQRRPFLCALVSRPIGMSPKAYCSHTALSDGAEYRITLLMPTAFSSIKPSRCALSMMSSAATSSQSLHQSVPKRMLVGCFMSVLSSSKIIALLVLLQSASAVGAKFAAGDRRTAIRAVFRCFC